MRQVQCSSCEMWHLFKHYLTCHCFLAYICQTIRTIWFKINTLDNYYCHVMPSLTIIGLFTYRHVFTFHLLAILSRFNSRSLTLAFIAFLSCSFTGGTRPTWSPSAAIIFLLIVRRVSESCCIEIDLVLVLYAACVGLRRLLNYLEQQKTSSVEQPNKQKMNKIFNLPRF